MTESSRTFVPAAGHDWFLPLYDPMVKLLGGNAVHQALVDQAALRPGHRVLEVGCGTGTLAIAIKRLQANVDVVGLDPDPKALARAKHKAARVPVDVQFDQGFGDELPYSAASFDRVFSSLMFHHLSAGEKDKFLRAVRRVLKPGGSFHMVDFEATGNGTHSVLAHLLHSGDPLQDSSEARLLQLMSEAGLTHPEKVGSRKIFVWRIGYYRAGAPN